VAKDQPGGGCGHAHGEGQGALRQSGLRGRPGGVHAGDPEGPEEGRSLPLARAVPGAGAG